MFLFVLAIIAALIAVAGWFVARITKRRLAQPNVSSYERENVQMGQLVGRAALVVGIIAAVLCGFFSSFTSVAANSVGIVTAYGHPTGTIGSGAHMLAPWDNVESYSTRIQVTQRLAGPKGDVPGADCVQVNLKGGASACADITLRYVVNPQDVVALWQRYGDFNTVRDSFLRSATDNAAKIVYGEYAPQDAISGDAIPAITKAMNGELGSQLAGSGLTLVAVAPGQLHLDPTVQDRINDILNAQTATSVAQQKLQQNEAQAQANQALSNSLSTPVLEQNCLDVEQVVKAPVFNCFPGSGSSATPLVTVPSGH
jgi:regulator of protease activity HflC (stomatin/prohibitin superfamily)